MSYPCRFCSSLHANKRRHPGAGSNAKLTPRFGHRFAFCSRIFCMTHFFRKYDLSALPHRTFRRPALVLTSSSFELLRTESTRGIFTKRFKIRIRSSPHFVNKTLDEARKKCMKAQEMLWSDYDKSGKDLLSEMSHAFASVEK